MSRRRCLAEHTGADLLWWQAYEVAYGRLGPERDDILMALSTRSAHMPHSDDLPNLENYLPQWGLPEEEQERRPLEQPGLW